MEEEQVNSGASDAAEDPYEHFTHSEQNPSFDAPADTEENSEPSVKLPEEPAGKQDEEGESSEHPKKLGGWQRKFQRYEAQIAELKAQLDGRTQPQNTATQSAGDDGQPNPNDPKYKTDSGAFQYAADFAKHELKQELKQAETQKNIENRVNAHLEREAAFEESTPDYAEKVTELWQQGYMTPPLMDAILEKSDMTEQVAYHLAQYPADAVELQKVAFNPKLLETSIRKIEAFIKSGAGKEVVAVRQTKAAAPISPVKSGSSSAVPKDLVDAEDDYEEFAKIRESQIRKRRG